MLCVFVMGIGPMSIITPNLHEIQADETFEILIHTNIS